MRTGNILKTIVCVSISLVIMEGGERWGWAANAPENMLETIQTQILRLRQAFKLQTQKAEEERRLIHAHLKSKLEAVVTTQQSLDATYPQFQQKVDELLAVLHANNDKIAALEQSLDAVETQMNSNLNDIESQIAVMKQYGVPQKPTPKPNEPEPQTGASLSDFSIGELFRAAYRFFMEREYDVAIGGFQKIVEDYPTHQLAGAAQYWIAESFMRLEEYDLAIQEYDRLISTYPYADKIADAFYGKGVALARLGKIAEAQALFTYIVEHFPETMPAQKSKDRLKELREM